MPFEVFAGVDCLCDSFEADPLHGVNSLKGEVFLGQGQDGWMGAGAHFVSDAGGGLVLELVKIVLSGVAIVVVPQEGQEDLCQPGGVSVE